MSELTGQLLSVRLQNLAGEAAGHNNESAQCEITFDNPLDINAKNILLIVCLSNLCWAILDDGPGVNNIENLWGQGEGIKVKYGDDKIGNKIAGELASATFFEPDKLMYFSRCHDSNLRIHQQLNAQMHKMIELIKEEDIDLTVANDKIIKGANKLVRKPEPDTDKFDADNVNYIKDLFKNNEYIDRYFDTNCSGMLKVFKYEEGNNSGFLKLVSELPSILDKIEFITYNTLQAFRGEKKFTYIVVDDNTTRVINKESCNKNFILGKKALLDEDDEDYEEQIIIPNATFGDFGEKVLTIWNTIYEYEGKLYNKSSIINYNDEEEFLISEKTNNIIREPIKRYLGLPVNESIKNMICKEEYKVCEFPLLLSFIDKDEAESQKKLMGETTIESLKRVYIYYKGRFIEKCKAPIVGIQERSLPNFRIILCLNEESSKLVKIRAQKSSITLDTAHPIIIKTIEEMLKPILTKYSSPNTVIQNGINSWESYKTDVLRSLGVIIATPPAPAPAPTPVPAPAPRPAPTPTPAHVLPPAPPTERGPAPTVLSCLNKNQTIVQLERIKKLLKENNDKYRTKNDKKKLYTQLNNIERELLLDDDCLDEKLEFIAELVRSSTVTGAVKNAASLQDL